MGSINSVRGRKEVDRMKAETKEIIDDLEHMKNWGEFFAYQHRSIDRTIELIKEFDGQSEQARLDRAVQKAFEEGYCVEKDNGDWSEDGEEYELNLETIASNETQLLEWAEQEVTK